MGGQDCEVISMNDRGKVIEFAMNDKCAAGTGKFFEAMARALHCTLEEFSALSLQSDSPANITKQCSVFAESEVVTLINSGVNAAHIAAGLTDSIARRLQAMVYRLGIVPEVVFTGGCAKNESLIRMLESKLGESIARLPDNPQIVGALGAALFARERALKTGQSDADHAACEDFATGIGSWGFLTSTYNKRANMWRPCVMKGDGSDNYRTLHAPLNLPLHFLSKLGPGPVRASY